MTSFINNRSLSYLLEIVSLMLISYQGLKLLGMFFYKIIKIDCCLASELKKKAAPLAAVVNEKN